MRWAARAVSITRSSGSLYVAMNTSTVSPGCGAGGLGRSRARHIVSPKSSESMRLYVSASTSGIAIQSASVFTEKSSRQMM